MHRSPEACRYRPTRHLMCLNAGKATTFTGVSPGVAVLVDTSEDERIALSLTAQRLMSESARMDPGAEIVRVTSLDGTPIAALRSGSGPPVVLVHGGTSSAFSWRLVAPLLEPRFTVYAMQRRGRGHSGDGPEYSIVREGEDIAALAEAIGEPLNLVGHSYGANCALEASLLVDKLRRLVLYEPAIEWTNPPGYLERLDALLAAGKREEALLLVLKVGAALTEAEIEALRSSPTWSERVELMHTLPREERVCETYVADPERFSAVSVPTLLVKGELSPYANSVGRARTALPHSEVATLLGQGHAEIATAPELFANELFRFLE